MPPSMVAFTFRPRTASATVSSALASSERNASIIERRHLSAMLGV